MNWEQLQKDVEAHRESRAADTKGFTALELRAPDLAALALAGKRLADEVRGISCDFVKGDATRERLEQAEAAFRKASGESHE